jgi:FAD/FMN-containing dehydrogenase
VRLPGEVAAVARAAATLVRAFREAGAEPLLTLDTEGTAAFWASVNDFPALRAGPREALIRVSTLPSEAMPAQDLAQSLALQHDLTLRWLADLQAGALWLRLWAPDATLSASAIAFTNALRDTLANLARRWPHAILLACPDAYTSDIPVWGADPETLPLMREIKRQFDPSRLLNPGRLAGRL